ncbi:uncharacterized protein BJ212DRAFT_1371148 [Suillus subaureus]|uniref:Uncharacterized protein n=1 Tax=Suillus subaureus TaxID=48587 RepID=A0A9P7E6B3_9AGAM|nr:uncharacterized protein BJ212DRAFT_1371148 [Suillus subaureus]KAG1812070.1 hypothetical protein BJ212DRAFT_1371148 [Suillus subaureus]
MFHKHNPNASRRSCHLPSADSIMSNPKCLRNHARMRFSILCPHAFTLNRLPMKHPNSSSARGRRCHIQMQSSAAYPCSSSALHPIAMKQLNSQNVQGKVPPIVKLIVLSMLLQFGISRYDFLGCVQFPGSYNFCADIVAPRLVRASGKRCSAWTDTFRYQNSAIWASTWYALEPSDRTFDGTQATPRDQVNKRGINLHNSPRVSMADENRLPKLFQDLIVFVYEPDQSGLSTQRQLASVPGSPAHCIVIVGNRPAMYGFGLKLSSASDCCSRISHDCYSLFRLLFSALTYRI